MAFFRCRKVVQVARLLTIRSKPAAETMTRNGSKTDWGVPVVPGDSVTTVVGRGIDRVVIGDVVLVIVSGEQE